VAPLTITSDLGVPDILTAIGFQACMVLKALNEDEGKTLDSGFIVLNPRKYEDGKEFFW
jgi:hypothetical protein